jgi:uncharacterized Ntn-hydrolase superfamily protein
LTSATGVVNMPRVTFSIVAFDRATDSCGVAVASKCLAVGHAVPWGAADAGAIATQALANLAYGPDGIALLRAGRAAPDVVSELVGKDELAARRQVGIVDGSGRAANHTGDECLPWAGGIVDGEVAVQGNILAGEHVVRSMLDAYRASGSEPFVRRLLRALEAGDAAGGDRRGKQSSSLRVWREGAAYGGGLDIAVDLRVDDDPEPVAELARLVDLHYLYFTRPEPGTLLDLDDDLEREITAGLAVLGYEPEQGFGESLARWIGTENFEERDVPGKIDPLVLEHLRRQAAAAAVA